MCKPTIENGMTFQVKPEGLIPLADRFERECELFTPWALIVFRTQKNIKILNKAILFLSPEHFRIMVEITVLAIRTSKDDLVCLMITGQ